MAVLGGLLGMTISANAQRRALRTLDDGVFAPKGQWVIGSSVSYSEHTEKNYDFFVFEHIHSDGYTFKLSPMFAYTYKDNQAVGLRLNYGRTLFRMDDTTLNLDNEMLFEIDNVYQLEHSYTVTGFYRRYIPIGDTKRFALFADAQASMGGSEGKLANGKGEQLTGTFSRSNRLSVGVTPGLVAMISNVAAVEVSVGVLGVEFGRKTQVTNQVEFGEQSHTIANFRVNLFSIGLGIAVYL